MGPPVKKTDHNFFQGFRFGIQIVDFLQSIIKQYIPGFQNDQPLT